jgi:hypothetical protein
MFPSTSELAKQHPLILYDTSILDATNAERSHRIAYRADLENAFACHNFCTVKSVAYEVLRYYVHNKDKNLRSLVESHVVDLGDRKPLFKDIRDRLEPEALRLGVIRGFEKERKTDLNLVSLAFTLASGGPVALVSGDKKLTRLAQWQRATADELPFKMHPVTVYYFNNEYVWFGKVPEPVNGDISLRLVSYTPDTPAPAAAIVPIGA